MHPNTNPPPTPGEMKFLVEKMCKELKQFVLWDLCSGLGGWSEAFLHDSRWKVFRFDNSDLEEISSLTCTYDEDVLSWMDWVDKYPKPDLVLASPPCLEFSFGYNAPGPKAKREGRDFEPDMSVVKACFDIISYTEPRWWCLENVVGAIKHFRTLLGHPRQIIQPFVLWGTIPFIPNIQAHSHFENKCDNFDIGDPLRSNYRAKIPFALSNAVYRLWYDQMTLKEWS